MITYIGDYTLPGQVSYLAQSHASFRIHHTLLQEVVQPLQAR